MTLLSFCSMTWAKDCQSSKGEDAYTTACGTMPSIFLDSASSKPFNTEVTTISAATPNIKPAIDTKEIKDKNLLAFFERVKRNPIKMGRERRIS